VKLAADRQEAVADVETQTDVPSGSLLALDLVRTPLETGRGGGRTLIGSE